MGQQLIIRNSQMEALRGPAIAALRLRLADALQKFWPDLCRRIGEEGVEAYAAHAIERCRAWGIEMEHDHFRYLNLMAVLGADFDEEEEWAREVLERRALRGTTRLNDLCELAVLRLTH